MLSLHHCPEARSMRALWILEEMGLPFELHELDFSMASLRDPAFLAVSPLGRVPCLVDGDTRVFESGAIMIHLAEKSGKFLPADTVGRSRVIQWLMFQMGGVGPMMGQANVFYRYFPEKIQPAIDRYQSEGRRLFEVLNTQLGKTEYLAGDYSIADMANWAWVRTHRWSGIDIEGLEHLQRWHNAIKVRPGAEKGITVPIDMRLLRDGKEDSKETKDFIKGAQSMVQGIKKD